MIVRPGLRDLVQLVGYSLRSPDFELTSRYIETREYFLDGTVQTDIPNGWGDEDAGIASPDKRRAWTLRLGWKSLASRDLLALREIEVIPYYTNDPLLVTPWRVILDSFTCDGRKKKFSISQYEAVYANGAPRFVESPQGASGYALEVYRNGVPLSTSAYSSASGAEAGGTVIITSSLYGKGDILDVYYVPLFSCRRAGGESSFAPASLETLSLTLETLW